MRIISKFKDYYDSLQAFYDKEDTIYDRKQEELYNKRFSVEHLHPPIREMVYGRNQLGDSLLYLRGTLFFCGKRYSFYYKDIWPREYFLTLKEVETHCKWNPKNGHSPFNEHSKKLFTIAAADSTDYLPLHLHYNAPILLLETYGYSEHKLTINPRLVDTAMPKILHPYEVYQTIDMYLSNQMAQNKNPIPERTQELIRDSKGFDDKSFKCESPGKKTNRRERKNWWK